jgi:hypothetical protein
MPYECMNFEDVCNRTLVCYRGFYLNLVVGKRMVVACVNWVKPRVGNLSLYR